MTTPTAHQVTQQLSISTGEVGSIVSQSPRRAGVWPLTFRSASGWPEVDMDPVATNGGNGTSTSTRTSQESYDATPSQVPLPDARPEPGVTSSSEPTDASVRVRAAVALRSLTRLEAASDETWLQTAETFRRTFRKLRQTEPRHADLAQIVSDALRFTSRTRFSDYEAAVKPLERAGDALLDSFIPTETELQIQKDLLANGWKLTPGYVGRSLAP